MRFSWDLWLNMLENDNSNLLTKFRVHITITLNIFKIIQVLNHGITQSPWPPNFESLPYPRGDGRFNLFSLKWGERMNFKVPGAILPLGCMFLSTRVKAFWGVVATPLWRSRVSADAAITILMAIYGGWVIVPPDYFNLKKKHAITVTIIMQ